MPSGTIRDFYMGHRLVVLPDYQGLGIGTKFNDWCGKYMLSKGLKFYCKTAHYKLKDYYKSHNCWQIVNEHTLVFSESMIKHTNNLPKGVNPFEVTKPFKVYDSTNSKDLKNLAHWINRPLITARYVGEDYVNKPHKRLIFEADCTYKKAFDVIKNNLDNKYYYDCFCDGCTNEGEIVRACRGLSLCSYALFNSDNEISNGVFDNIDVKDCVYFYDDEHNKLLDRCKSLGVRCERITDGFVNDTLLFDL